MLFQNIDRIMSVGDVIKTRINQDLLLYDKHGRTIELVISKRTINWAGIFPFWDEPVRVTGIENKDLWAATFLNLDTETYFHKKETWIVDDEGW